MGESLDELPPRALQPFRLTPLAALAPVVSRSGSELRCPGTLGVSRAQGGVAGPRGLLPTEVVFGWKV